MNCWYVKASSFYGKKGHCEESCVNVLNLHRIDLDRSILCRFNTFTWYQSRRTARENTHQIIFVGTED
jgi:hypothetical protein